MRSMFNQGTDLRRILEHTVIRDEVELQLLMTELYDEHYGICNHDIADHEDPMSLIGLHPKEDRFTHSRLDYMRQDFIRYKVHEHSGLSYLEFKQLPLYEMELLLEDCRKIISKEVKVLEGLQNATQLGEK